MIKPASAVEAMEMNNRLIALGIGLSKQFRYPINPARISKTTLAAMKPKKWVASGLSISVRMVAITPVTVTVPNLLAHQRAKINEITPSMSHRKGMWVNFQKMGAMVILSTLHRAAHMDIAAMSRASK